MAVTIVASLTPLAGKTTIAATLAAKASAGETGVAILRAFAPVQDDADAVTFKKLLPDAVTVDPVVLNGTSPTQEEVQEAAERINKLSAAEVIVEGCSGTAEQNLPLAEAVDGRIVAVVPFAEDPVAGAQGYGERLAGVIINRVPRYRTGSHLDAKKNALQAAGITCLGWLPEDRLLLAPTVRNIVEHLGGEFIVAEENADRVVDHILLGAQVHGKGPDYFDIHERVCAVLQGRKPDMQMAALQTPTVKGVVATAGIRPIEYVYYEAKTLGTPLAVVEQDEKDSAALLDSLNERVRFDHPDKLARSLELAGERVDFEALGING